MREILNEYPKIKRLAYHLFGALPSSIRLGKDFFKWYAFFETSESWDVEQMKGFQLERIRCLLKELVRSSEFYRDRLGNLNVEQITSFDEFREKIPTLSKVEFRSNHKAILNSSIKKRRLEKSKTSGTTGMALHFYHPPRDRARDQAAIYHQWKRVGFSPTASRRAEFRALTAPDRIVDYFPHKNKIRCSILNLKSEHVRYYADEIRKNRIDYYHGYPSAFYLLALEISRSGIDFPQPKAVLLASEIVYDWQVDKIMEAFPKAKIFAHYGCAERTVLAGWCEHRREYHVLPQYGRLEVDDRTSEIIGTNLYNSVNGFVRYRMTDTVLEINQEPCPDCHRPYTPRLIKLGGRKEDFLFSPENGWIPPAIVTYPLKSLKTIREIQFYQKERTEICARYSTHFSDGQLLKNDLKKIESGLYHLFGTTMSINFEAVDDFERGPTGKFKWIVSELDEMPSR